ncbi:MAG: hypothetical protein U0X75_16810 [Acidobacteriota bacterium]
MAGRQCRAPDYSAASTSQPATPSGSFAAGNREFQVETAALSTAEDVGNVVIGVSNNRPVYMT